MNMSFEYRFSVRRSAKLSSKFQVAASLHVEWSRLLNIFIGKCKENHISLLLKKSLRENFIFCRSTVNFESLNLQRVKKMFEIKELCTKNEVFH